MRLIQVEPGKPWAEVSKGKKPISQTKNLPIDCPQRDQQADEVMWLVAHVMWCHVIMSFDVMCFLVLRYVTWCNAMSCDLRSCDELSSVATWCDAMGWHLMSLWCDVAGCDVTLCGSKSLCDVATWKIIWWSVLQSTTRYYAILQNTTLYYTLLQNTTQYYKALLQTTRYYKVLQRCLRMSDFLLRQLFVLSHVFLWLLRSSTRASACFFWTPVVQKGPQK